MKETPLTLAVDEVIALKMKVVDEFIKSVAEPLGNIGNPEALIGKKYEDWTPLDIQLLGQIYGEGNDTPLAKLIYKKARAELKILEAETL